MRSVQNTPRWSARAARIWDALHARLAGRSNRITSFVNEPEPRTIGSILRGRQLVEGHFLFGGHLVDTPDDRIWDIVAPDSEFEHDRHGFDWMDDLAALGNYGAQRRMQEWVREWIDRFGRGTGPGWTSELTGRRLTRWINHGAFLLSGDGKDFADEYFRTQVRHTIFLSRRWQSAPVGLPRFEALGGLVYAALALEDQDRYLESATFALAQECDQYIGANGELPSRNAMELLEIFSILTFTTTSMSEAGHIAPQSILAAEERIAPVLRTVRHANGNLARFHGGGRGAEGRLDGALAASGVKARSSTGLAMGFARLSGGRTSVIVDASAPPATRYSANAHASTLAFEMTSGRRPLIVSCGSGAIFGRTWHRAGRATPSHSTLGIEGTSSSKLGRPVWMDGHFVELLSSIPGEVFADLEVGAEDNALSLRHDGFVPSHGLHHSRHLRLSDNGGSLKGEDEIAALSGENRQILDLRRAARAGGGAVGFFVRFHLHPDVDAETNKAFTAATLKLKSGESWQFSFNGPVNLTLEPSLYLEKGWLEPRATKQIVLSGSILEYSAVVGWQLAKSKGTPTAVRDLEMDEAIGT